MSGNHHSDPKAIRAGLDFPVIDSDGHWLEYAPIVADYLKKVGGSAAVDGFQSRDRNVASTILMSPRSAARNAGRSRPGGPPDQEHTRSGDRDAPRLLYRRLDELGLDFTVLYPTTGSAFRSSVTTSAPGDLPRVQHVTSAERFGEFADRHDAGRGDSDEHAGGGDRRTGIRG